MSSPSDLAPQTMYGFPSLTQPDAYDVTIIGGGPAGLSAALVLGRCRRKVLIIDSGKPRNRFSNSMHAFLSREGVSPAEFTSISREQVFAYPTVDHKEGVAVDAFQTEDHRFVVVTDDGSRYLSRKILIATGVVDEPPEVKNFDQFYGVSVHHCPICDGYEWRDKTVAVYGKQSKGFGLVQEMTAWTRKLYLLTDGPCDLDLDKRSYLAHLRIPIIETPIASLEGKEAKLEKVLFEDGEELECSAMFFSTGQKQHSDVALKLGCVLAENGCIYTGDCEATNVPGVYCSGDSSRNSQLVVVAAAEGAIAACAINKSLTGEYKDAKQQMVKQC